MAHIGPIKVSLNIDQSNSEHAYHEAFNKVREAAITPQPYHRCHCIPVLSLVPYICSCRIELGITVALRAHLGMVWHYFSLEAVKDLTVPRIKLRPLCRRLSPIGVGSCLVRLSAFEMTYCLTATAVYSLFQNETRLTLA